MEIYLAIAGASLFALGLGFAAWRKSSSKDKSKATAPEKGNSAALGKKQSDKIARTTRSEAAENLEQERPTTLQDVGGVDLADRLTATRSSFVGRIRQILGSRETLDDQTIEELEEVLISADVGVRVTTEIVSAIQDEIETTSKKDASVVPALLRKHARTILQEAQVDAPEHSQKPYVIMIVGVNGVGKTTTIGKLAQRYVQAQKSVVLAAGDTFRAAAVEQLEIWGRKVGAHVVKGSEKSGPGSVIFEAVQYAKSSGADVVIADTAGRLHTSSPLMEELSRVFRSVRKSLDGREPDEVLLIVDATTGQNAMQQAKMFSSALPLTGLVLTKLDGSAKGGVSLSLVRELNVPIRYLGVGEKVEDLRRFDIDEFVSALFAEEPSSNAA